jgi:ribulose-phosphate 3-epimerase
VDLALVMTVDPGYGGQTLIPSTIDKVSRLQDRDPGGPGIARIEVDGGIGPDTPAVARLGADIFVAGVAIFRHPQGAAAGVRALRASLQPALA